MANTESVAALLKDPRKKLKKKPQDQSRATGIANAIQRRIANGSYDKGKGRTSATRNNIASVTAGGGFKAGPTVGTAQAQRMPLKGGSSLAALGKQGNRSAGYASAIQKRLAGTKADVIHKRRRPKRSFF